MITAFNSIESTMYHLGRYYNEYGLRDDEHDMDWIEYYKLMNELREMNS